MQFLKILFWCLLAFVAAVFGFSIAPEKGWLSATTIGLGLVALTAIVAFVAVERRAENPIVPFTQPGCG